MAREQRVNRFYMEAQADRIERVLAQHRVQARVCGGAVLPRMLRFRLAAGQGTRVSRVKHLSEELALALGSDDVRVNRDGHDLVVEVPRDEAETVLLLPTMDRLPRIPRYTAVLGIAEDGTPLLVRLSSPDVAHILVSGATGSGKTELLRAMLTSLALENRVRDLQMVLIDPKGRGLAPLVALPQVVGGLIVDVDDAIDMLAQLVDEMVRRDELGVSHPRLVIAIDEVAELIIQGGEAVSTPLTRLVQRGREAGLHVIAGAQKPSSKVFGPQLKANFPVRLVGRVGSAQDALVAAGVGGTGAEKLLGRGDFVAVAGGSVTRFQGAFVSPAEIAEVCEMLRPRRAYGAQARAVRQ